jgi:hypothetical protein
MICGGHRDCIDTGTTQNRVGAALICLLCFKAIAVQFADELGLVKAEAFDDLEKKYNLAVDRATQFDKSLSEFRKAFDGAIADFNHRAGLGVVVVSDDSSSDEFSFIVK